MTCHSPALVIYTDGIYRFWCWISLMSSVWMVGFRGESENMFQMESDIDNEVTLLTGNSPESSFDSYSDIQSSTIHDFSDDSESNLWTLLMVTDHCHLYWFKWDCILAKLRRLIARSYTVCWCLLFDESLSHLYCVLLRLLQLYKVVSDQLTGLPSRFGCILMSSSVWLCVGIHCVSASCQW